MTTPSTSSGMRKVGIAIAGFTVLLCGVLLLVVPIPGTSVVMMPLGLAILAREFEWARKLLVWSTGAIKRAWLGMVRCFGRSPGIPSVTPAALPCG